MQFIKRKQALAALAMALCCITQANAALNGTYTINPGGTASSTVYLTLTSAISDLVSGTRADGGPANGSGVSGPVVLELASGYTSTGETFPLTIAAITGTSSSNTVTLKPASGATVTLTGSSTSILLLNGADYFTIDGSNNGTTSKDLTISNTSTSSNSAVIRLVSLGAGAGATDNTIKNCTITNGSVTTTTYGIVVGGSTTTATTGADNDNLTIRNNAISNCTRHIYVFGTASATSGGNDNVLITQNTLSLSGSNQTFEGIQLGNSLNSTVSLNTFNLSTSANAGPVAIGIETGVNNTIVTRNLISQSATSSTGGWSGRGITVGTGLTSSNVTVSNNVIYNIVGSPWSAFQNAAPMGIGIGVLGNTTNAAAITATAGGVNVYHNSVNMYGTVTPATSNALSAALYVGVNSSALDIRNNIFVNTYVSAGSQPNPKHYAVYSAAANTAYTTMNYNNYYVSGAQNILGFIGSDRTTLTDIQTGFGQNANSIVTDPLFTSNTNLSPSTSSPVAAVGANAGITIDYDGNTRSTTPSIGAYEVGIPWTGATNNTWATGTNWATGSAPTSSQMAIIPTGLTNYPIISSGTVTAGGISIASGGTVTVNGGTLQLAGNIGNSGTFNATGGSIELNGTQAQTIAAGTLNVTNLTLNNSTGATITSGMVNIIGTYTPTSGTLTTGGFLTLKSTASGTARVAAGATGGGYISGNVITERYVPGGRRAFRFFSHPFTGSIALSQLTDDIDLTGSGGSANGFTTTGSNNPSAFWYDVTTGDNSNTGNNPGWTAFTHTNGSGANAWNQYGVARILVRGAIGEGLTSAAYTPSAVTLDVAGAVNQGNTTVNLTKGSGTNFVLVGNPFLSQVNMDALTLTNVGSSFYIWDANQGTRGAYTSYTYGSSSYNLPVCGAFVTTLTANGSIVFEEADKTTGTAGAPFKTTGIANQVELKLEDSTIYWDRLLLNFDDNAMATVDYPDAAKLYNPDMTFYTLSKDDSMLSIDTRPYADGEVIKLGLYAGIKKNFKFTAPNVNMPAGTKLYFTDKLLNVTQQVTQGFEYWFAVDANTASWGNNRFELNTQGTPTNGIANINESKLKVKLVPNPTTDNVTLYYEGAGKELNIVVTNMMGVKVATATAANINGQIVLPTAGIAAGIYNVVIYNGSEVMTQKLIKQ